MKIEFTTLAGTHFKSNDSQTYFYAIYNKDGKQIKKRIKKHEFEQAQMQDEIEKRYAEEQAAELDKAAEDENVTAEEFCKMVTESDIYCRHPHGEDLSKPAEIEDDIDDWNDVQDSRNAWSAVDEITYDVVAHAIRSLGKNDDEIEKIMGMIGKDVKMVMDFNEATSNLNADEFNAYIKSQLDVLLNGEATGSLTEATEAHEEAETTENTPDSSNATESLGEAKKNASKKKAEKATKKTRKSKDTFHTSTAAPGLTLTAKQTSFMLHLSDTCFWEEGLDSVIWVDCLCDDIQGEFAGKPMTVGAMISTLCEKKLGVRATERRDGKKCTSFTLTELGKKVAEELGLH